MVKSPAGIENIRLGNIAEGYAACASTTANGSPRNYYDAGYEEAGWAEPYKVTAAPVISRKTTDGKLELVQSFASDAAERDFTITMTLYNRSAGTLYKVRLDRFADFDVDNTLGSDVFHRSPRAVFAVDDVAHINLIAMTELTPAAFSTAIHSWPTWKRNVCNQSTEASPTNPGIGSAAFPITSERWPREHPRRSRSNTRVAEKRRRTCTNK